MAAIDSTANGPRTGAGEHPIAARGRTEGPAPGGATRKAVQAAMVGNFVEWFDYGVYGAISATLAVVFFPSSDPTAAMLSAYAVFALSFFARPLGGVIAGRLADRLGRRPVLSGTVLIMSAATCLIGLIPSYNAIGVAAPVLLTVCRLAQGLAAGGEYAGAVSFVVEYGPRQRRGLYASFVSMSVFLGLMAGSAATALLTSVLSADAMHSWGWRLLFLIAVPMGSVGLYIRSRLEDTPEFAEVVAAGEVEASPVKAAVQKEWRTMAVFFGFSICNAVGSYLFAGYLTNYVVDEGGISHQQALLANTLATLVLVALLPLSGVLTDRWGRRPMLIAGTVLFTVLSVPALLLGGQGGFAAALGAQLMFVVALFFIAVPVTVSVAEMFSAKVRVTAGAIAYNLSFTVFGGTAPFVAQSLVGGTGDQLAPAFYVMAVAVVSAAVAVFAYRERAQAGR
ncbi:MFS transporter [Streptomyces sp. NPDC001661]